jgi:S-adenosylmethionine:diacylglycerol 3-amino-3-carboxypropyl transferase
MPKTKSTFEVLNDVADKYMEGPFEETRLFRQMQRIVSVHGETMGLGRGKDMFNIVMLALLDVESGWTDAQLEARAKKQRKMNEAKAKRMEAKVARKLPPKPGKVSPAKMAEAETKKRKG